MSLPAKRQTAELLATMHIHEAHTSVLTTSGPHFHQPPMHLQPLPHWGDSRWEQQFWPASSPPLAGQHCLAPQPCASAPAGPEPLAAAAHTGGMLQGQWTPPVVGADAGALGAAGSAAVAPRQDTLHDKTGLALACGTKVSALHQCTARHCELPRHSSSRTSKSACTLDQCVAAC